MSGYVLQMKSLNIFEKKVYQWTKIETIRSENMGNIEVNKTAPDFEVEDFHGHTFKLSEFRGEKSVLLVLNRGFM